MSEILSFHPGRHKKSPFEIMRIFQEAGGVADKTIMGHLESEAKIKLLVYRLCHHCIVV